MDHQEQHRQKKDHEREQEKKEHKAHEEQELKNSWPVPPAVLIIGAVLTGAAILVWTFFIWPMIQQPK